MADARKLVLVRLRRTMLMSRAQVAAVQKLALESLSVYTLRDIDPTPYSLNLIRLFWKSVIHD